MTDESIRDLLTRLGRTADEVADSLAAAGITGQVNEPCECAIARYLQANGYESVGVVNVNAGPGRDRFTVATASDGYVIGDDGPIADFIRAFDREEYPQLIATGGGW